VSHFWGALQGPSTFLKPSLHALHSSFRAYIVVELRERGDNTFHQFASRAIIDRLGGGTESNTQSLKLQPEQRVVVLVAGKTTNSVHYHTVNTALVFTTIGEQILELRAVCGLCGLALLNKDAVHCPALPAAKLTASLLLSFQAEVLYLVLRGNATIDDGAQEIVALVELDYSTAFQGNWLRTFVCVHFGACS